MQSWHKECPVTDCWYFASAFIFFQFYCKCIQLFGELLLFQRIKKDSNGFWLWLWVGVSSLIDMYSTQTVNCGDSRAKLGLKSVLTFCCPIIWALMLIMSYDCNRDNNRREDINRCPRLKIQVDQRFQLLWVMMSDLELITGLCLCLLNRNVMLCSYVTPPKRITVKPLCDSLRMWVIASRRRVAICTRNFEFINFTAQLRNLIIGLTDAL